MSKSFMPIIHGAHGTRADEADTVQTANAVAEALHRLGFVTEILAVDLDLGVLAQLAERHPVAVFYLVDALRGDGRLGTLPAAVLEHLGLTVTGSPVAALVATQSKLLTKQLLRAHDLPTADWWLSGAEVPPDRTVIVKPVAEDASVGVDAGSVVAGRKSAQTMRQRQRRFGGRFFAEDFLEGREFNIAVIETSRGPTVLPIPEMVFGGFEKGRPQIIDYQAKWDPASEVYRKTVRRFGLERGEPRLATRLSEVVLRCWEVFELAGYARVDIRLNRDGYPCVLEINANPCLAPDAGFAAAACEAGLTYDTMIDRIVRAALRAEPGPA